MNGLCELIEILLMLYKQESDKNEIYNLVEW